MSLPDKILAVHASFDGAGIPHAFGGALALAWCTGRARGTVDIDCNVFVDVGGTRRVLDALPGEVTWTDDDAARIKRDGQARLWWDTIPVDLFLSTTGFHDEAAARTRRHLFAGTEVPFLACSDLAVFKAFFSRTQDWADLEEMVGVGSLDVDRVLGVLVRYLGPADERVARLRSLVPPPA